MFDLDAYLARIGLDGPGSLAEVHRAHATSIPFENLDPHRGIPVSLAIEDLQRKLVRERRGGYCFEHNMLLKGALEEMGMDVEMLLARVRVGLSPGVAVRPRSHLVLRVSDGGTTWLADVGFGGGTLLEPIPFAEGGEREQAGWRYRIVREDPELVLQSLDRGEWGDMYALLPFPVPLVDVETINWWTSTFPESPFVTGFVVSLQDREGLRTVMSDWSELVLSERTPLATTQIPLEREQVPEVLASRFGLPGFALSRDGRLLASGSP